MRNVNEKKFTDKVWLFVLIFTIVLVVIITAITTIVHSKEELRVVYVAGALLIVAMICATYLVKQMIDYSLQIERKNIVNKKLEEIICDGNETIVKFESEVEIELKNEKGEFARIKGKEIKFVLKK